jgi:hypothetical protein
LDGFTREELAGRAGVAVDYIDHLIEQAWRPAWIQGPWSN